MTGRSGAVPLPPLPDWGVAGAVAHLRDLVAPIDEAVLGYRRQLESDGWSADAAEQMAVAFYLAQMSAICGAMQRGPGAGS